MVTRRQTFGLAVACLVGGTSGWVPPHTQNADAWLDVEPTALVSLPPAGPEVGLTFDDGPDPRFTPAVLDLLGEHAAVATFFLIGRNARAHPQLVRRILAEGHRIGSHTRDHPWLDRLASAAVDRQVAAGVDDVRAAGGAPSPLFRSPRGWTSPAVAAAVRRHGLRSVFWTDCLEAHLHLGVSHAVDVVAGNLGPGAILLCHDGGSLAGPYPQDLDRSRTVEALPGLLRRITAAGYRTRLL